MRLGKRREVIKAIKDAAKALSAASGWAEQVSDYLRHAPQDLGDRWDITRETATEWRAERTASVATIWAKDYDGILSVAGVMPNGRKYRRQFPLDDKAVKKMISLIQSIEQKARI